MYNQLKKHLYGSICTIRGAAEKALNGQDVMIRSDCVVFPSVHPTIPVYRTDLLYKGAVQFVPHNMLVFKKYPDFLDNWARHKVELLTRPNFEMREEIINEMRGE